jgi:hypothetical protein
MNTNHLEQAIKSIFRISQPIFKAAKDKETLTKIIVRQAKEAIRLAEEYNKKYKIPLEESDLIRTDSLIGKIYPIVKKARWDIFGKEDPPFKDHIEAGEWIYRESKAPIPKDKEEKAKNYEDYFNSFVKHKLNNEFWSGGAYVDFGQKIITFPGIKKENAGWTESVPVGWSTKLLILSEAVRKITSIIDFQDYAITAFILSGTKPILPKYTIQTNWSTNQIQNDNWFKREQVIIKLNYTDLTFEEFYNIYKEYRSRLNFTRKKSIRDKQLLIYKMIQDEGGIPKKGKTSFWIRIQEKWNTAYPDDSYKTWEGLYRAYNNINDKLEPEN